MTDVAEAYGLGGAPVAVVVLALFAIVMVRSHATYWAGRGVVRGARTVTEGRWTPAWWRTMTVQLERWTDRRTAQRGLSLVRRWGPVAVTLAYLTVGLQTAVFAAAGLVRIPYPRFLLASIPGALAWAVVWATVGLSAVWAGAALLAASPWALAGLLAVVVLLVGGLVRSRRARGPARGADPEAPPVAD